MATLIGREIDWFRDVSRTDEDKGKWGRVYIRFRLNRESASADLIMLHNAYPESAPKLVYPNAVVASAGAVVSIDIVVRDEQDDVGCGFSLQPGVFLGRSDNETRAIAKKLYVVGAPAQGPDGAATWRVDNVGRYQDQANKIQFESLASLERGDRVTGMRAMLLPRSRCDIYAWPVKAYNDLDEGEAYSSEFPPPGAGNPPFGDRSDAKPIALKEVDLGASFESRQPAPMASGEQGLKRVEIQREMTGTDRRLGFLSVQFFVLDGNSRPAAGARNQPVRLQAKLAAACPRGKAA